MLDAEAWIFARDFAVQSFIDVHTSFDRHITVRVRPELPTRGVCFSPVFIQFLFARGKRSIVILGADVGLGKPCGAPRNRAVSHLLHSPDAHPFVAESRAHARFNHLVNASRADKTIDPHSQVTGIASGVKRLESQRTSQSLPHGGASR